MSSSTIVPAAEIVALKQEIDNTLKPIAQALQTKVYAETLPIIGPLLTSAAGSAPIRRLPGARPTPPGASRTISRNALR